MTSPREALGYTEPLASSRGCAKSHAAAAAVYEIVGDSQRAALARGLLPYLGMHTAEPTPVTESPRRIVAIAFDSPLRAQEALFAALRLQEQQLLSLHDAVFVKRGEDGRVEVVDTSNPAAAAAAVPSSLFGALVGTLVAGPIGMLVGGVLAGGGGALAAKLIDTGIPNRVVGELRELTAPGQTVLALLVSDIAGMAVIEELRRFRGAHVVYAQVPRESLELMRQVLAGSR